MTNDDLQLSFGKRLRISGEHGFAVPPLARAAVTHIVSALPREIEAVS